MRIIIVGGGFCGALAARLVEKKLPTAEIILIDRKNYFEYLPSIHKVIFNTETFKDITMPFSTLFKRVKVIIGEVTEVTPTAVRIRKSTFAFDYLIISTGIKYPVLLENKKKVFALETGREAARIGSEVLAAKRILIIGGGLIGVELAGELVTKLQHKELAIVHLHERLLERNSPEASAYARNFLETRGARIIFGEKVVRHEGDSFITDKGSVIKAEVGLWCAGIKCDTSFMKEFPKRVFTSKKALHVNDCLQLNGYLNIFVGGDISGVPEEKTAQNAERHAHLIVNNIVALTQHKPLREYAPRSEPLVISLGDYTAILSTKKYVWGGFLPAVLKKLIEVYVLWKYGR